MPFTSWVFGGLKIDLICALISPDTKIEKSVLTFVLLFQSNFNTNPL